MEAVMLIRYLLWVVPALVPGACRGSDIAPGPATALAASFARNERGPVVPLDSAAIAQAIGRAGAVQPGGVLRFNFPRGDLTVMVDGVQLKPALALGSYAVFEATHDGALAMGDLVLQESEIQPVMSKLEEGGIEVTAVHHHVLRQAPPIFYMHFHGEGNAVTVAQAIHAAIALTSTPPPSPGAPPTLALDTAGIARALGHSGKLNGSVYQVSVPRLETLTDGGVVLPPAMGVATAINFQPTSGGNAAIAGDFVLLGGEVNAVIRALRGHGIEVAALHNHMLHDEPRLFFMHFWAVADAVQLAQGLRSALDATERGHREHGGEEHEH
jgi:Domain of Unknown Function (DUF1259)